jgi:hypothetical protein
VRNPTEKEKDQQTRNLQNSKTLREQHRKLVKDQSSDIGYYDALRGLEGASGLKDARELKPTQMSITYRQINEK